MRYYIKCRLDPSKRESLAKAINEKSLANGKIFNEGMQSALREATIDEGNIVQFIEICYWLESGLYPMTMEIPELNKFFQKIEIKDARQRD